MKRKYKIIVHENIGDSRVVLYRWVSIWFIKFWYAILEVDNTIFPDWFTVQEWMRRFNVPDERVIWKSKT